MQMMGVREATKKALQYIQRVSNKVVEAVAETSVSPKGPVTKHYYEAWVEPKLAPFWNTETNTSMTGEEYCARIGKMCEVYVMLPTVNFHEPCALLCDNDGCMTKSQFLPQWMCPTSHSMASMNSE